MRRLHLRLYLTIIGTMIAFALSAMVAWHAVAWPQGAAWSIETATQLSAAMLNAPHAPELEQRIVDTLARQLHADVALLGPDGPASVANHGRPFSFSAESRAEPGWDFNGNARTLSVRLDDGRMLAVHPHFRFLFHGLHMILMMGTIAALVALLAYPVARGITARLERLEQGVQKFGAGDLTARVAVEGRDEVSRLATRFNESAARVEQLVRANQMLLANCSHELRTPLTRMRLAVEQLVSGDGKVRAELTQNIAELDVLIGELLLSSRLDAAKRPERVESLDLLALTAEEAAHFDREVSGDQVTIEGDAVLLRRLVRNLLENARIHAGGASEIRVVRTGQDAQIIVDDAGPGIAPEDRERIFEPFYRRRDAGKSTGAGLGLSIVRQIARVHGGEVRYAPRAGGGSRFVVTFPVASATSEARPSSPPR